MRKIFALAAAAVLIASAAYAGPHGGHPGGHPGAGHPGVGHYGGHYGGHVGHYYGGYRSYGGYPYSYGYNWAPAIVGGALALGAAAAYSCWQWREFPDGSLHRVWVCE